MHPLSTKIHTASRESIISDRSEEDIDLTRPRHLLRFASDECDIVILSCNFSSKCHCIIGKSMESSMNFVAFEISPSSNPSGGLTAIVVVDWKSHDPGDDGKLLK